MRPLCGTYAAYTAHKRADEPIDEACLDAKRTYTREYMRVKRAEGHPSYGNAAMQRYRDWLRETVLGAYAPAGIRRCYCCGSPHELTLDHPLGNGGDEREALYGDRARAGWHFYGYLAARGLPEGYRVLCRSCNSSKNNGTRCRIHDEELQP